MSLEFQDAPNPGIMIIGEFLGMVGVGVAVGVTVGVAVGVSVGFSTSGNEVSVATPICLELELNAEKNR